MRIFILSLATALMLLILVEKIQANNIQITNLTLAHYNVSEKYAMLKYDISWENSWRGDLEDSSFEPYNYDAAWIFIKYRVEDEEWQHATLSTYSNNHIAPSGSVIEPVSDGKGVFMYRSENGTGTVSWTNAQIRWDYYIDGVADNLGDNVEIKIIAIEMVYVPEGAYYLGDGAATYRFHRGNSNTQPFLVTSEDEIRLGNDNASSLWALGHLYASVGSILSADYPKGFSAFYCMKHQVTQGQYAEFLNMLTEQQASVRRHTGGAIRYSLTGTHPNILATYPSRACNYLSWADGIAYLDWVGLRPMSEMEYEKASRGTLMPVAEEFAWGTASYILGSGLINDGTSSEATSSGNCNLNLAVSGPLRVGSFAHSNTNREESGATYYGILNMSDNLGNLVVSASNATAREFTRQNGDGILDENGNATIPSWPDNSASGAGWRGGHWGSSLSQGQTSFRVFVVANISDRIYDRGMRGVRSQD